MRNSHMHVLGLREALLGEVLEDKHRPFFIGLGLKHHIETIEEE